MNKKIEYDIASAFDQLNIEEMSKLMDSVDPAEFECPNDFTRKKIKDRTLEELKLKEEVGKNSINRPKGRILGKVMGAAAAIVIIMGSFMTFNTQAREMAQGFFSFIPGVGIVESEVPYYMLSDEATANDGKVNVKMTSVTINSKEIKVEYKVNLLEMQVVEAQSLKELFDQSDYENYFGIGDELTAKSGLTLNGKKLKKLSSQTVFTERGFGKYLVVTEAYSVKNLDTDKLQGGKLTLGDLEIDYSLKLAAQFNSKAEALKDQIICQRNGVAIVAVPEFKDTELKVYFYVVENGKYFAVQQVLPEITEEGVAYITAGDKRINGVYAQDEVNEDAVVFDISDCQDAEAFEIHIPTITASDRASVEISADYGTTEYEEYEISVFDYKKDKKTAYLKVSEGQSEEALMYFEKVNGRDSRFEYEQYPDQSKYAFSAELEDGESSLKLTNPIYRYDGDFIFIIKR